MKSNSIYYLSFNKKRSKNKVLIVFIIIFVILLVLLGILLGIKIFDKKNNKIYCLAIDKQNEVLDEKKAIEEAKKEEIRIRQEKTNKPFSEDQIYNIDHIYRSNGIKRVYLTFDDGPSEAVTPLILDLLKKENIKATFFVLGGNAEWYPSLVQREFNEGHYVANHGYTHKYSEIYANAQATLDEYNWTEQAIRNALNNQSYHSNLFRFPGGSNGGFYDSKKQESKELLKQNGVAYLDWNSLTNDADGANTKEQILQNAINTMGDDDAVVILMHDASDKILTYEALPDLINYLRQQGYVFQNIYDVI